MAITHKVTEVDSDSSTGVCAKCGPVALYFRRKQGNWACRVGIEEGKRGSKQHKLRTLKKRLLLEQEGKCAVCRVALDKAVVDHCHTSGFIRGILCHYCNVGLGHFQDNSELLRRAARYIEEQASRCDERLLY